MDVQERVLGALREHVGRPVRLDERLKDLGFRIPTNVSDSLDWLELVMTFEKVVGGYLLTCLFRGERSGLATLGRLI